MLNDRFGTSDDLKSLSRELHDRGMSVIPLCSVTTHSILVSRYLMVDIVVNDVMATSTNPDLSTYMFKNEVRITQHNQAPHPHLHFCIVAIPPLLCHGHVK